MISPKKNYSNRRVWAAILLLANYHVWPTSGSYTVYSAKIYYQIYKRLHVFSPTLFALYQISAQNALYLILQLVFIL